MTNFLANKTALCAYSNFCFTGDDRSEIEYDQIVSIQYGHK